MPAPQDRAPRERVRRKRIAIALVACVAVGIVYFFTLRSSEPTHGGKSLSEWVTQLVFVSYPRRDPEARVALRGMGEPAVRFLSRRVENDPTRWRLRLAEMTEDIPVVNGLCSVATFDRLAAVWALAEIGPTARSAIPALERAAKVEDRRLSVAAHASLIRIREESIEPHVAAFRQFGTSNSVRTAQLLGELGPYAKPAIPALLEGIQSTNYRVRFIAVFTLSSIGYESPECVSPLERLLSDPHEMVRGQALGGLANFGPLARTALPSVRPFLHHTNSALRFNALVYFDKVLSDEEFALVRDEVARAKSDPDSSVSDRAQAVLDRRPHGNSGNVTNR